MRKYPKITKAAKDQPCIRCDADNGTTRAAHYNGPYQHQYGKGRGIKCHDLMTAEFCDRCDVIFTEGSTTETLAKQGIVALWQDKYERSHEFSHWVNMTNIRRMERGVLK